jgi:two-component system chemotaxis sensor kinase CheA
MPPKWVAIPFSRIITTVGLFGYLPNPKDKFAYRKGAVRVWGHEYIPVTEVFFVNRIIATESHLSFDFDGRIVRKVLFRPLPGRSTRIRCMSTEDSELLKEFAVESQEHLADIENQLLTLESQGDNMDVALVNTVFRAIHSIKGAAGFMGLDTLGGLAHRAEEILNKLRNKELRPTSLVINTLLRAADRLKELIDDVENSNGQDVTNHISALEKILASDAPLLQDESTPEVSVDAQVECKTAETESSSNVHIDGSPMNDLGDVENQGSKPKSVSEEKGPIAFSQALTEALREFLIESHDNLEQIERDLLCLEKHPASEQLLNGIFRNMHTIKGSSGFLGFGKLEKVTHAAENILGGLRSNTFEFDASIGEAMFKSIDAVRKILCNIEETGNEGTDDFIDLQILLVQVLSHKTRGVKVKKKTPEAPAIAASPAKPATASDKQSAPVAASAAVPAPVSVATPPASPPSKASSPPASKLSATPGEPSAADSTIRVDVSLLDKLMTCVGELVLARNQILQFTNGQVDSELQRTSQRLNLITTELQESVMKTRMQPIGNVWSKFPRLVRDLATMCEKQVRIEMEGKETELDKTIIEAIKDPLTHLVRNTVDHGIEKPEIRRERGKNEEGCLTLRAYHEGGQVNIEICDDGGGLNSERIKAKAIEKGLVTAEQVARMSDRDVGNMIFLPGFSTAEKVSSVSGRGVGMDVVKTNIEKIGGTVDLQSTLGQGTTIKIKIPLTLAIIPALIVSSDHNRYAIPQVNLLELVRLDGAEVQKEIEHIQGAPVYRLRGRLLPLVYLREQLRTTADESTMAANRDALNIVVLRAEDRQFGLVVDRINDTEEIVVKPLSKQLKGIPVYSGTTIMGDGKVALILDVLGLAHTSNVISKGREPSRGDGAERSHGLFTGTETLLVMGVGESHRYALPLSEVTRLEKLDPKTIEIADHHEVVQYRGEILRLIRLSQSVGVSSIMESEELLDVIIYTRNQRSVGLVVDRIIDIVEEAVTVKRSSRGNCLVGSAVVNGQVTNLLDLPTIVGQADPYFFEPS